MVHKGSYISVLPKRTVDFRFQVLFVFWGDTDLLQCKQVPERNPFKCHVLFSCLFGPPKIDDGYNINHPQDLWMVSICLLFEDGKSISSTPLVACELH